MSVNLATSMYMKYNNSQQEKKKALAEVERKKLNKLTKNVIKKSTLSAAEGKTQADAPIKVALNLKGGDLTIEQVYELQKFQLTFAQKTHKFTMMLATYIKENPEHKKLVFWTLKGARHLLRIALNKFGIELSYVLGDVVSQEFQAKLIVVGDAGGFISAWNSVGIAAILGPCLSIIVVNLEITVRKHITNIKFLQKCLLHYLKFRKKFGKIKILARV